VGAAKKANIAVIILALDPPSEATSVPPSPSTAPTDSSCLTQKIPEGAVSVHNVDTTSFRPEMEATAAALSVRPEMEATAADLSEESKRKLTLSDCTFNVARLVTKDDCSNGVLPAHAQEAGCPSDGVLQQHGDAAWRMGKVAMVEDGCHVECRHTAPEEEGPSSNGPSSSDPAQVKKSFEPVPRARSPPSEISH